MAQTPTIGRIVHYKLSEFDATSINADRARLEGRSGNRVMEGDVLPAMIVRRWGSEPTSAVQLQVFLDGNDTYWATSRVCGEKPGQWSWPERV